MTRKSKPHDPAKEPEVIPELPGVAYSAANIAAAHNEVARRFPNILAALHAAERRENFERMWEALADLETD